MNLEIDRSLRLPDGQWAQTAAPKSLIVLHHTVGGSARGSVEWWASDPRMVGTAYVIERDGTIFEVFPPEGWCWHVGIKDARIEQRSIGIELTSEGALVERAGRLHAFDGKKPLGSTAHLVGTGRAVRLVKPWRGYEYFDAYDAAQVESAARLIRYLCIRYGIPLDIPTEAHSPEGNPRKWFGFKGVIHHAMVRKDKTDLHPLFPWATLRSLIGSA